MTSFFNFVAFKINQLLLLTFILWVASSWEGDCMCVCVFISRLRLHLAAWRMAPPRREDARHRHSNENDNQNN